MQQNSVLMKTGATLAIRIRKKQLCQKDLSSFDDVAVDIDVC